MTDEGFALYDFDPNSLPDGHLRAVGLVIAAASQAEHVLQLLIGGLLRTDELSAAALSASLGNSSKHTAVRNLMELNAASVPVMDRGDELLDDLRTSLNYRNMIAHKSLAIEYATGQVCVLEEKNREGLRLTMRAITVEEIERGASLIYERSMALMEYAMSEGFMPTPRDRSILPAIKRTPSARRERAAPEQPPEGPPEPA